ncbi:methyl-accepting chemotaxis protein [Clostridium gasigenes]|uniref:methyl-accepting chemotaxis protein n=1 Tax=Clostridium gasigenes TaxID=94869 RepID=UPI001C0E044A|nr:methyl-accepting chemotaxis protein [Clostridium gasigenes]MBU3109747.1 methyl-accepting chemotaxis protein [Clostridium gasigenes]
MKLKSKFIALFTIFALLPLILFGVINHYIVKSNTFEDSTEQLESITTTTSNSIGDVIDLLKNISTDISLRDDVTKYITTINANGSSPEEKEKITTRFKSDIERFSDLETLLVLDKNGTVIIDSLESLVGKDLSTMDYYKSLKETKKIQVSKVKKSIGSGNPISVIAVPIIKNNELQGTLLSTINLTSISNSYIKDVKIGTNGSVFIVQDDGTMIAHPNNDEILNQNFLKIDESTEVFKNLNGLTKYTYNGVTKEMSYRTDPNLGWTYISTIPMDELTATSDLITKTMLIIIFLVTIVVLLLALIISKGIAAPILNVSTAMNNVSKGDFTVLLDIKGNDEIALMSSHVNTTLESLRNTIKGVKDTSLIVSEDSSNLKNSALQMSTSASEVASAIQDVAKGTTDQASELMDIMSILDDFNNDIKTVESNLLNVTTKANESQNKAILGKDSIDLLKTSITTLAESFDTVVVKISDLSSTVSQIGSITDVINSISEQTNLLALNAAIEAARAGEQGRGFAVVADEVRNLAEESKSSSVKILSLIKSISKETTDVIDTTKSVRDLLTNQEEITTNTFQAFENIISSINDITPLMTQTKNSLDNANNSNSIINDKLHGVSAVSEEVSASAEEIAAASEELMASSDELALLAENMDNVSISLTDKINIFKI